MIPIAGQEISLSHQQQAVLNGLRQNPKHSILIPSIAGSGKTTTITYIADFLVSELNVSPSEIIIATYTASAGAKLRAEAKYEYRIVDTFHAIANTVMRMYELSSSSSSSSSKLYQCDEQLREFASFLRSDCRESLEFRRQIKYFINDETQDNNALMNSVAKSLHRSGTVIIAVGDLKQAIMQFQGGSCKHMLNFGRHFSPFQIHQLSVNRRCSIPIVKLARAIKSHGFIHPEYEKEMDLSLEEYDWEQKGVPAENRISRAPKPQLRMYYNNVQMIEGACDNIKRKLLRIPAYKLVIIARTNLTLKKCKAALLARGVPCILLRKITNQTKAINRREKEGGGASGEQKEAMELERLGKVVLTTPHAAKGLEWDDGEILEFHDHIFPSIREKDLQVERNLAYTAVTRFRRNLTIWNCFPFTSTFILELAKDDSIGDLFYGTSGGVVTDFPNESVHLGTILLVNEDGVDLEEKIPLKPEKHGKLMQAVGFWISNLNGCSYLHIKRKLLPFPLSIEIRNIPELYSLPSLEKEGEESPSFVDGDHKEGEENADTESDDDDLLPTEIDFEDTEDGVDLDPYRHTDWAERECLEEELNDFFDCWMIRFLQQIKRDYEDEKIEKYTFAPAEATYSEMVQSAVHVEKNKIQMMYSFYKQKYQNTELDWSKILLPIYWTSAFSGYLNGNLGIVYSKMTDSRLSDYKIILNEAAATIHYLIYQWKPFAEFQLHQFFHLQGKIKPQPFILVNQNRILVWSFETTDFNCFPQEIVIKALIYAAIYSSILKFNIEFIQVYQIFNRKICTVDISDWSNTQKTQFLNYIQTARRDIFPGFEEEKEPETVSVPSPTSAKRYSPDSCLLVECSPHSRLKSKISRAAPRSQRKKIVCFSTSIKISKQKG